MGWLNRLVTDVVVEKGEVAVVYVDVDLDFFKVFSEAICGSDVFCFRAFEKFKYSLATFGTLPLMVSKVLFDFGDLKAGGLAHAADVEKIGAARVGVREVLRRVAQDARPCLDVSEDSLLAQNLVKLPLRDSVGLETLAASAHNVSLSFVDTHDLDRLDAFKVVVLNFLALIVLLVLVNRLHVD